MQVRHYAGKMLKGVSWPFRSIPRFISLLLIAGALYVTWYSSAWLGGYLRLGTQPQSVVQAVPTPRPDPQTIHMTAGQIADLVQQAANDAIAPLSDKLDALGQKIATAAPPGPTASSPPSITSGEGSTIVVVGNGSTVTLPPLMRSSTEPPVSVADNRFEVPPPAATAAVSTPAPTAAPQPRQRQPTRVAVNRPRVVPPPAQSGMGVYGNRTGWASLAQLNINRHP